MAPSLSVVMPVFNEPAWISVAVADAVTALENSEFRDAEFVVVDDGSDQETQSALAGLAPPFPLRVLRQENQGRLAARRAGIDAARGDLVLLLDARVSLYPGALRFINEQIADGEPLPVWNAHCDIDVDGNPYARFWNVITEIAYRRYYADPRTLSYGSDDFDYYPKGTTCFLAPRDALLEGFESFETSYADTRNANDDTSIIRKIVERQPINISPGFGCLYRSRDSLPKFLRHAYHRGIVFYDGWSESGGRFAKLISAFFPLSAAAFVLAVARPFRAIKLLASVPIAVAVAARAMRRSPADCAALALLSLPWLGVYSAGIWRGRSLARSARRGSG